MTDREPRASYVLRQIFGHHFGPLPPRHPRRQPTWPPPRYHLRATDSYAPLAFLQTSRERGYAPTARSFGVDGELAYVVRVDVDGGAIDGRGTTLEVLFGHDSAFVVTVGSGRDAEGRLVRWTEDREP